MSEAFFHPARGFVPSGDDGEPWIHLVDPALDRVQGRRRWEARTAQWRARALAEAVFGGEVEARLAGHGGGHAFRGLLHLDVPFAGLERHREGEARFLAAAARDPVLSGVPFVYVFGARSGG